MEINISPRMSGKTTKLIEWVKEKKNRVVLFSSNSEAFHLKAQYPKIANKLYYWEEWRASRDFNKGNKEIGIDNVDCLLHAMLGRNIKKIEFNQELVESVKFENKKIIK